ncbi:CYTH domain-containing protein [Alkaliphilus peptidifermentans]|uniref:Uncharacterized protein YjbK n=1 Tax=Alkaliphilus peptidifermentans DSM 18978 TaxID=1120976 RepID=A0A1G5L955_9FIRM|nr:CYTH domain-containing protein [Alkaliphilus peptidifermentans]SCZ09437.1 Uncharacterized protein YjbK [Alkaliphilus peptidifermentans DSM 18978]
MDNTEVEYKVMLDEANYKIILLLSQQYDFKNVTQTNYYFDTTDFLLSRNKTTLRIREIKNTYKATLKIKDVEKTDNNITVSNEYDYCIEKNVFNSIINNEKNILEIVTDLNSVLDGRVKNSDSLKYIGKLTTERIIFKPMDDMKPAELDKNIYCGFIDYELEWELNNYREIPIIEQWLKNINVPYYDCIHSKYGRFIKKLIADKNL